MWYVGGRVASSLPWRKVEMVRASLGMKLVARLTGVHTAKKAYCGEGRMEAALSPTLLTRPTRSGGSLDLNLMLEGGEIISITGSLSIPTPRKEATFWVWAREGRGCLTSGSSFVL